MSRRSLRSSSAITTPTTSFSATTPRKAPPKPKAKPGPDPASDAESSQLSAADAETSDYDNEEPEPSESSSEDEAAESDSDAAPPSKRRRVSSNAKKSRASTTPKKPPTPAKQAKGQELWRPGVKAGLGPGKQVVIQKPKPRPAGKTPYKDETIHPNTMLFLKDLAANNDREWLKMHDPDYRTSWKDFTSFVESLQPKIMEFDETVPELPVKDVIFRIYRDIRFSSDQTPYKAHFSAAWSRTGRKGPYGHYYIHIQPGRNFVGGGLWHPEAQPVALIRRDIDRRPHRLREALMNPDLRKEFFGGIGKDEKRVVKAFVDRNSSNALKTKPKGYDGDHRDIDLLRLKNYTIGTSISDEEILGPKALDRVAEILSHMEPLITYLNSTVMPDEPADASDEDDDED